MKKLIIILCLAAFAACAAFAGCSTTQSSDPGIVLYTPDATEVIKPVPTTIPGSTLAPTEAPVTTEGAPVVNSEEAQQPEGTPQAVTPDYSVFDDAALLGNSTFEGLFRFGVVTHGDFYTKVGLNVLTVHTASTDRGTKPIIDELYNKPYAKVVLMFGENELGWPSPLSFIQKYEELLDAVWLRLPDTEIYIVAMPPVSKNYGGGTTGVNNVNIQNYNAMMKDLADRRGCHYITVPNALMTVDGALPDAASSDGLHLNLQYARYWADHICLSVMGVYD